MARERHAARRAAIEERYRAMIESLSIPAERMGSELLRERGDHRTLHARPSSCWRLAAE
jgi:hypothetical protein